MSRGEAGFWKLSMVTVLAVASMSTAVATSAVTSSPISVYDAPATGGRSGLTPRAGVSWLAYQEGTATDFAAVGLTVSLTASRQLDSGAALQLGGTLTAVPVKDQSLGVPVRFATIDGAWLTALGGESPAVMRAYLGAGAYYKRMFVSDNRFGYTDLAGPLALFVLERSVGARDTARVEVRFQPVMDGVVPLSPSNRELGLGFEWRRIQATGAPLGLLAEWRELRVRISGAQVQSNFLTLGVSYGI